ncbi:MAG: hypothetical protein HOP15_13380 [Planctomycetes bacterium]|nr:hypothetical protein [Planctomycetota bacterium]
MAQLSFQAMLAGIRIAALLSALTGSSCAGIEVAPVDATTGTFHSSATAFTFLGLDFPQSAMLLARANAADSQLPNLIVTRERVFPYFWRLDFLLDVISVRWASVQGTYGPAD